MPCYNSLPAKLKKQVLNRMKQEKKAQLVRVKEEKAATKSNRNND